MSGTYSFSMASPGVSEQKFQVPGRCLHLVSSSLGFLPVVTDRGDFFILRPGQSVMVPKGSEFREVNIKLDPVPGSKNAGELFIGDAWVQGTRTLGTQFVRDPYRNDSLSGVATTGFGSIGGGGIGIPAVQLRNWVIVGKLLSVRRITVSASAATIYRLFVASVMNGAETSRTRVMAGPFGTGFGSITASNAIAQALYGGTELTVGFLSASTNVVIELERPILLAYGEQLHVMCDLAAASLSVCFFCDELPEATIATETATLA